MNEYTWPDLHIGLSHSFDVELTTEMMSAFAFLSGDVNPLHTDRAYARAAGFRDAVAFGQLTASFYSTLVGVFLPGKFAFLHGINIDFVEPAYPGDRLCITGKVTHLTEAWRRIEVKAVIENQQGRLVSRARIRVALLGT